MSSGRTLAALLVVVVGVVHLQQYADFISDVPTIGTLFVLNAAGAGVIVVMLAIPKLRALGALAGIGLCVGSLVSIAISMTGGGLFGYTEPTLRAPMTLAIIAEVLGLAVLALMVARGRRTA